MQSKPGSLTSWFAIDDANLLEKRIQSLNANMVMSCVVAIALTLVISMMVMSHVSNDLLMGGGAAVVLLLAVRAFFLHRARHLTSQHKRQLLRTEWQFSALALLIFGYLGYLIAAGPAVSPEIQVALIAIGLLAPIAALRTIGASKLATLASALPMLIGAAVALSYLESAFKPALLAGFAVGAFIVVDQVWRALSRTEKIQQSEDREKSLLSQQLALFSTSQLGIAQTVDSSVGRANGRFRQWFGEGSGDTLTADTAATIGMTPERLTRLIRRADKRILAHESRTVHIQLNGSTPRHFSVQVRRFDPSNPERGLLWTVSDQTSDWLRRQADERAASRDPLTGALNRRTLHKRISSMLGRDLRRQPFGILCVDINRFGELNVANGEGFGDQILCIVTRRLQRMLREQDVIARTGGNEFVLVLENVNSMDRGTQIAEKVMETLSAPIVLTSMTCSIAASVGIAVAPMHGRRTDEVLGRARASMFALKRTMVQVQAGRIGRRSP
ncbi:MAG: GGDEF domain-containing protein [Burkholderiaceae bacterium]